MKCKSLKRCIVILLCLSVLMGLLSAPAVSAEEQVEVVTVSAVAQRAEALSREVNSLPAAGGDRNGIVRLYGFSQSADGSTDMKELRGKHYLVRNQDNVFYALDGSWTGTNDNLPLKVVTTEGSTYFYIASGISPSMAFDFHYTGLASNGMPTYVLRFNNGRNLGIGTQYTSYTNLYYVKGDTTADLSKAPKIRFEHPDGAGWARIRNDSGTHGLRQNSGLTCVRWKDNSAGDNAYDGNALYLYRLWSTTALCEAIHQMQPYLETPEAYAEDVYTAFLDCMEQSIALFSKHNPFPTNFIDPYDFIQETLDAQTSALKAFASKLTPLTEGTVSQLAAAVQVKLGTIPATGALRNGRVRLFGFTQSVDGSTDMTGLKGKYYLVRGQDNTFYALDGSWTGTNGNLPLKVVTPNDVSTQLYISGGINPSMAFEFHYTGLASNGMPGYVLRFSNGRNLGIGTQYTNYTNLYYVKADTTASLSSAPKIRFEHPDGVGWVRIRNLDGTHGLRQSSDMSCVRWKDNSAGDNAYDGNALYLYRLWSTHELRTAISDMSSYLDTPEFYDEEVYREFLACMEASMNLFVKYNPVPTALINPYDFIQETLDAQEATLRSFADRLNSTMIDPSTESLNTTTKVHQLPSVCVRDEGDYQHNMSYIIQTRSGKIILIDGGWEKNNSDGKYLFAYLQKITGDATPHIDAWFITHAHGDHHGAVATFANLYADQVTVDAFYHHYFTQAEQTKYMPNESMSGVERVPAMMKKLRNKNGGAVQEVKVNSRHSGKCNSSFDFDEVHIDILLDFSDVMWAVDNVSGTYSGTWAVEGRYFKNETFKSLVAGNFNETSIVFRASVGGKNILFTGDAGYVGGYMLNKYHDAHASDSSKYYSLQSDYVQVAHHGYYGLTQATYNRIDPDVGLWPTPKYEYTGSKSDLALPYALDWFSAMGVTNYPSYLGPQVFEFPVARSSAAISIPAELRPYVFNAEYYSAKYADLATLYGTDEAQLYYHFVNYGIEEGRCASPFFDVKYYAGQNSQHMTDTFRGNFVKAFADFLNNYRTSNLRKLSAQFDPKVYAANHAELVGQGYVTNFDLLKHYANNGYRTGERASACHLTADGTTYHNNCTFTDAITPTCTTAGRTQSVKCNACGLILAEQIAIPALGHSYSYTDQGAEHIASCACGENVNEPHSYIDGICICGAVEGPIVDESITILHTLNLASDISVSYVVKADLLAEYDSFYLECVVPEYEGNAIAGSKTYTIEPVDKNGYYYFTLEGMTALRMNDIIESTLHMEKNGRMYLSNVDYYSISQYAYAQLNNASAESSLKSLCADLLRYGAYAQQFKNYRTDNRADAAMTDAHRAYLSEMENVVFGNNNSYLNDCTDPTVAWVGKTLDLGSKIAIVYVADLSNYKETLDDVSLRVRFTNMNGVEETMILREPKLFASGTNRYAFTFDGLLAAELRCVVSAAVYAGEEQVSQTLIYSADTYGKGQSGLLGELCKSLFAYSDTALAYFS